MIDTTFFDIQELLAEEIQNIDIGNNKYSPNRRLVRIINREKDIISTILESGGHPVENNLPLQLYKMSENENIFREQLGLGYGNLAQDYIKENYFVGTRIKGKKREILEEKKEIEDKEVFLNELDLEFFFPGKGEKYKEIINKLYNKDEEILFWTISRKEMNRILEVIINKQNKFSKSKNDIEVISEKVKFIENLEFFFETMILDKNIDYNCSADWSDSLNKSKIKKEVLYLIEYSELESRFGNKEDELFIEYGINKENLDKAKFLIHHHTNLIEYGSNYNKFCNIVDMNNTTLYSEIVFNICSNDELLNNFVKNINLDELHELGKVIDKSNMSFLKELLRENIGSLVDNINSGILLEIVKREE